MQKDTELCKGDIQEANLRNAGLPQMDPEKFILPAEFKCRFKNQLWLDLEKKKKKKSLQNISIWAFAYCFCCTFDFKQMCIC